MSKKPEWYRETDQALALLGWVPLAAVLGTGLWLLWYFTDLSIAEIPTSILIGAALFALVWIVLFWIPEGIWPMVHNAFARRRNKRHGFEN